MFSTSNNNPVIDEKYEVLSVLGKGWTSKVFMVKDKKDEEEKLYAAKVYIPKILNVKERFDCEYEIMKKISEHPNVLKVHYGGVGEYVNIWGRKKSILYMVIDLCKNREIFDFVKQSGAFSEELARYYFKKIYSTISHLHGMKIVHRDIKLENVLLNDDFEPIVADFGFASYFEENELFYEDLGTHEYKSPELLNLKGYNPMENDIYALGVILFVMLVGGLPFNKGAVTSKGMYATFVNQNEVYWSSVEKIIKKTPSKEAVTLLNGMLSYKNRFTKSDIENSEWFKGETISEKEAKQLMEERSKSVKGDEFSIDMELSSLNEYVGSRGINTNDTLLGLLSSIDNLDTDMMTLKKWNKEGSTLLDFFEFKQEPVDKTLKYIVSTLISLFPNIALSLKENKYKLIGNQVNKEEIEEDAELEQVFDLSLNFNSKIRNVDFEIELFVDEETDNTIVQVIKRSQMSQTEYSSLLAALKESFKNGSK